MKLSDIKQILAERKITLTKSLGQNFMHDGNQLRRLVALAEIGPLDRLLEIGPGLGPLTELLLPQAQEVLALEKDGRLCGILRERFAGIPHLRLLETDAVDYLCHKPHDWSEWKLVANLPYSVASRILVDLALQEKGPQLMVVTLQSEVAQRLIAQAGDDAYGLLSLLVQLNYAPAGHFQIPATCFFPQPDVDSAAVTLRRRQPLALDPQRQADFIRIVKRGFSQRRKMMLKLLKQDWPPDRLTLAFQRLNLDVQTRAEAVSLSQFISLTRLLTEPRPAQDPDSPNHHPEAKVVPPTNMTDELFDVVNEQDEVIGQRIRADVHRLGLVHRAVHVLIFNRHGQVFLQKRSMTKDTAPGAWDSSASGHLNVGETYDVAAPREVHEELGIVLPEPPCRLFKIQPSAATGQEHVWVYRAEHEGPFQLHPQEIETGEWFAPAAVTQWLAQRPHEFAESFRLIWNRSQSLPDRPSILD